MVIFYGLVVSLIDKSVKIILHFRCVLRDTCQRVLENIMLLHLQKSKILQFEFINFGFKINQL
jgi:hypothetical protein